MTKPARDWERDWELCQKATDGEWYIESGDLEDYIRFRVIDGNRIYGEGEIGIIDGGCNYRNDAKFIVEARKALPYWLQRVKELEKEIEKRNKILHTIESLVKAIGKVIPEHIKSELQEGERNGGSDEGNGNTAD